MNWSNVLQQYGIDVPDKEEFNIRCPFHNDRNPSLSINIKKNLWICHAGCGSGRLRSFLEQYLGRSLFKFEFDQIAAVDLLLHDEEKEEDDQSLPEVNLPFEPMKVPVWIFDRGFSKGSLIKWDCRMTSSGDLIIPILDENRRCVGWVCRQTEGKQPKYLYFKGLRTSKILFGAYNILKRCNQICVTEGTLDTIWLDQHGFLSVALLGRNMSRRQEQILLDLYPQEVILCLDNDEPGQSGLDEIQRRLVSKCFVTRITIPPEYKDVQDIRDPKLLKEVILTRSVI